MSTFEQLGMGFIALAGVASFVAALINAGKQAGIVKDGTAPDWSLGLNLVFFAAFIILRLFVPDIDIAGVDQLAANAADILVAILGFVAQLGASRVANAALRGTPVVGYSHSGN